MKEITEYQVEKLSTWTKERESLAKKVVEMVTSPQDTNIEDEIETLLKYNNSVDVLDSIEREIGLKIKKSENIKLASKIWLARKKTIKY